MKFHLQVCSFCGFSASVDTVSFLWKKKEMKQTPHSAAVVTAEDRAAPGTQRHRGFSCSLCSTAAVFATGRTFFTEVFSNYRCIKGFWSFPLKHYEMLYRFCSLNNCKLPFQCPTALDSFVESRADFFFLIYNALKMVSNGKKKKETI